MLHAKINKVRNVAHYQVIARKQDLTVIGCIHRTIGTSVVTAPRRFHSADLLFFTKELVELRLRIFLQTWRDTPVWNDELIARPLRQDGPAVANRLDIHD